VTKHGGHGVPFFVPSITFSIDVKNVPGKIKNVKNVARIKNV